MTEGILDTVVGYSGSYDENACNPTYQNIQDYAESIRVTFDKSKLSYGDLLQMFFAYHTPSHRNFSGSQYRSAIFVYSPEQREMVMEALSRLGAAYSRMVDVEDASDFYAAEEYHQNYLDKAMGKF